MNCLLEVLILFIVRIVSLDILAELLVQFNLNKTLLLDSLMSEFDSLKHISLAYLVHFTLNHHDVVVCSGNHEFEIAVLHLAEWRVDSEFTVDPCYANLRDRASERNVAGCECS